MVKRFVVLTFRALSICQNESGTQRDYWEKRQIEDQSHQEIEKKLITFLELSSALEVFSCWMCFISAA